MQMISADALQQTHLGHHFLQNNPSSRLNLGASRDADLRAELNQSIIYAKRIQEGMMLKEKHLQRFFPESFILLEPRNIVSGDFYWFSRVGTKIIVAAADCTGHGIPGAFMSVLGISLLNQLVIEEQQTNPSLILQRLDHKINKAFSYSSELENEANRDGMDIALACIDSESNEIHFSGAFRPFYHFAGDKLTEYKGSRYPIGGQRLEQSRSYPSLKIKFSAGDRIFLCSDGFADQFGGPADKKFMSSKFRQLLLKTCYRPVAEQHLELRRSFSEWKNNTIQTDDVLVIGIRL